MEKVTKIGKDGRDKLPGPFSTYHSFSKKPGSWNLTFGHILRTHTLRHTDTHTHTFTHTLIHTHSHIHTLHIHIHMHTD